MKELTPQYVLADLFDSDDFPVVVPEPQAAAEIVIQRLIDSGFVIRPAEGCEAEIQRLRDAKRRALAIADERAIEANKLRLENERLRTQLAEQSRS